MGRGRKPKARVWATKENLDNLYNKQSLSYAQIAKMYSTFPNTVRRACKRLGVCSRDKSDAQKNYLEKNSHPMEGRPRSEEEKLRISEGVQEHWDTLDDDEACERREKMSERARRKWDDLTEAEKAASIAKMHAANRERAGLGSRNENAVAEELMERGYVVVQRTTDYTPGHRYEIDICLPNENVAIEWDGVAHFEPIYGEQQLKKTQAKDAQKNKSLTSWGWAVIRFKDRSTAHTMAYCRRATDALEKAIKDAKLGKTYVIDTK